MNPVIQATMTTAKSAASATEIHREPLETGPRDQVDIARPSIDVKPPPELPAAPTVNGCSSVTPVVFGNAASPVSGYLSVEGPALHGPAGGAIQCSSGQLGYLFSSLPMMPTTRANDSTSIEGGPAPSPRGAHGKPAKASPSPGASAGTTGQLQQMEATEAEKNEIQKSLARMFADRKKMEMEIAQMFQDLHTYVYSCIESSLLTQARARSKVHDGWMKYING